MQDQVLVCRFRKLNNPSPQCGRKGGVCKDIWSTLRGLKPHSCSEKGSCNRLSLAQQHRSCLWAWAKLVPLWMCQGMESGDAFLCLHHLYHLQMGGRGRRINCWSCARGHLWGWPWRWYNGSVTLPGLLRCRRWTSLGTQNGSTACLRGCRGPLGALALVPMDSRLSCQSLSSVTYLVGWHLWGSVAPNKLMLRPDAVKLTLLGWAPLDISLELGVCSSRISFV